MKRYSVWMDVTETWKVYFEAQDLEQAKQILRDLETGEVDTEDVPEYFEKNKGIEKHYALDTLEEEGEANG
jgi:hypothetical protein